MNTIADSLNFVKCALAKRDIVPHLKNFRIENGTIRSFDGQLSLCSPIDLSINCTPEGLKFHKVISACTDTIKMHLTPKGRLSLKSGKLKAFIECLDENEVLPHVLPEGEMYSLDGEKLIDALKKIRIFIGDDASHLWSTTVLINNGSIYASNNVIAAQYWLGLTNLPNALCIPKRAINELLRIKKIPIKIQTDFRSLTFHYENGCWLRTNLYENSWPSALDKVLNTSNSAKPVEMDDDCRETIVKDLTSLLPFTDGAGRVYCNDGILSTSLIEDEGASIETKLTTINGVFNLEMLIKALSVAKSYDFTITPCAFFSNSLRGVIKEMRN